MKANQPTLLAALKEAAAQAQPLGTDRQAERSRGRLEERYVAVYDLPSAADADWEARRLIYVVRSGRREGKPYRRESYYLTSRVDTAAGFAEGIRAHWAVENNLRWTKDAQMNEDGSGIRSQRAATVLSLLKSAVLTRYRRAGHASLKEATALYANKVKELLLLLRT